MDFRGDDGQATTEHIGLMALIAVVLVAAIAGAAVAAPGIFKKVKDGFEHALCVVIGERCSLREPCPVRRQTDKGGQNLSVGWLRLAHDRILEIERLSDGSYKLSLLEGVRGGAGVDMPTKKVGAGVEADASAGITLGLRSGREYVAATPEEARALARSLRRQALPGVQSQLSGALDLVGLSDADPSVDSYVLAGAGAADAVAKLGFKGILDAGGDASVGAEMGIKVAAHRKEVTTYYKAEGKIGAFIDALTGYEPKTRRRTVAADESAPASGKIDMKKRPAAPTTPPGDDPQPTTAVSVLDSPIKGEAGMKGSIALTWGPGPQLIEVEAIGSTQVGSKMHEYRVRLDASSPAVAAAIDAWRHDPLSDDRLRDIATTAAGRARIDDRTFAVADEKRAHGGLLGGLRDLSADLGLELVDEREISTLVEQRSRDEDGIWETRTDCVTVVAAAR